MSKISYIMIQIRVDVHNNVYAPFEEGVAYCFAHVGPSVGMSVSLNLVQLITPEHSVPEASNLVGDSP